MASKKQITTASTNSDKFLKRKQKQHVRMVSNSLEKLQRDILNSLHILDKDSTGKLAGIKVNLSNAQKLQAKIERLFDSDFNAGTRKIVNDFKSAHADVLGNFKTIGEAASFTNVDRVMTNVLRDGYYADFLAIGESAKQKVVQSVYDNVLGNGSFQDMESQIRQSLIGSAAKSVTGVSLAQYSRLYARDMIMNYHNEVMMKKADDLGMDTFLFIGTIMGKTRRFCRRRVGNPYKRKEINSWKYKWQGKSGPAMTHRGGYNCRHHWQPVRDEWLDDQEKSMMNKLWKLDKKGKPIKPGKKKPAPPKPKPKPKQKPPETIGKGTITKPPSYDEIKAKVKAVNDSPEFKAIAIEKVKIDQKIKLTKVKQQESLEKWRKTQADAIKANLVDKPPAMIKAQDAFYKYSKEITLLEQKGMKLAKDQTELRNSTVLGMITPPAGGTIKWTPFPGMSKTMQNKVAKNFKETERLLHPDVIKKIPSQDIRYKSGIRAYYTKAAQTATGIKRKGTLHLGSGKATTQTHEFGHALEYEYPGLQKRAQKFLKTRAGDDPLTAIYSGTKEMGWRDGFYDHYVGKYYSHGATEIVSMGLEQMQRSPYAFLRLDPGHFDFILKAMWGVK